MATLQEASNVATELNTAMTPTIAAQRKALDELAPTLDSENKLLFDIVGPKCNGHSVRHRHGHRRHAERPGGVPERPAQRHHPER